MKKITALCLAFVCVLGLMGCSAPWTDKEIKNSASVEIRKYDNGKLCGVYTVSNDNEVSDICKKISSLPAKKMDYHKPARTQYSIYFLNNEGQEIQSVDFLFGNTVVTNGGIYGITDEINIMEYIEEIISKATKKDYTAIDLTAFSQYLDNENFVPGLSQSEFIDQVDKYSCEGDPLSEITMGMYYDGDFGGGYKAMGEKCGYENYYVAANDRKTASYSNSFYTDIPLDDLTLPCGITFDDTLSTLLKKLGVNFDPKDDFISDKENEGTMTLKSDEGSELKLVNNLLLADESDKPLYDFTLRYTEKYKTTRGDGKESDVTRTVIIFFTDENYKLGRLELSVVERFDIK